MKITSFIALIFLILPITSIAGTSSTEALIKVSKLILADAVIDKFRSNHETANDCAQKYSFKDSGGHSVIRQIDEGNCLHHIPVIEIDIVLSSVSEADDVIPNAFRSRSDCWNTFVNVGILRSPIARQERIRNYCNKAPLAKNASSIPMVADNSHSVFELIAEKANNVAPKLNSAEAAQ